MREKLDAAIAEIVMKYDQTSPKGKGADAVFDEWAAFAKEFNPWARGVIIKALMEPSEGMLEAGENTFSPSYTGTPVSSPGAVWQAMLQAIKDE